MRLIPPPVNIGPKEGFTEDNDIFGYEKFGENMMNIVAANSASEFVMLLDGSWGTGKSVFAKQWASLLRKNDFSVIEFDAFRNDYQEDAFIALAGEIYKLSETKKIAENTIRTFSDSAKKAGSILVPALARVGIRAATAGIATMEDIKGFKEFVEAIGKEGASITEEIISKRLESRHADEMALETFQKSLGDMASALNTAVKKERNKDNEGDKVDRPLVIIVDELDRCKPTFALNILERIKHLFSTENVVFVLVADFGQLENVVSGAYGGGNFDGAKYLEKFFHVRATLPKVERLNQWSSYTNYLWSRMSKSNKIKSEFQDVLRYLEEFEKQADQRSLRMIERIMSHVVLAYQATSKSGWRAPVAVFGLCLLRHVDPEGFRNALSGTLTFEHFAKISCIDKWPSQVAQEIVKKEWGNYLHGKPHSDMEMRHLANQIANFDLA